MSKKQENTGFLCENCGRQVLPVSSGSYRNHCPFCLYSKHVDWVPGDRANPCGGLMAPVAYHYHSKKGYQVIQRCQKCGVEQVNIIIRAGDQPDDFELILKLPVQ